MANGFWSQAADLPRLVVEAEYNEAVEVKEMMSRSPEDRQSDDARLKFLHDHAGTRTWLTFAMLRAAGQQTREGAYHMSTNSRSQRERQMLDSRDDSVFAEAVEILQSIANNPRDREFYETRLKLQRDELSRFDAARDLARAEGRVMGRIQLLQQWLGLPESPDDALEGLSLDQLAAMEGDLQRQMRERG